MDAFDRQRADADANSQWRKVLGQVTGSWSYATRDLEGFEAATPQQRNDIRETLGRWTGNKLNTTDATRVSEPAVNQAIRGATPRTELLDKDIRTMDLAFTMSRTKSRVTVARGFSNGMHIMPDDWETRDLTGFEWTNDGFTAVTGDLDAAEAYVGERDIRGFGIKFALPKGQPAIAIPDDIGGLDNEGEIVLPRGLRFRVVKDRGFQGEFGLRKLDVEIVKPTNALRSRGPAAQRLREAGRPKA